MDDKYPIIGILGWKVGDEIFGVTSPYYQYASYFGRPRIISIEEDVDDRINLLILPGGADVNPERYGQSPKWNTSKSDLIKEFFDVHILPKYIEKGIPIFGICRGIQTLAVHFGGILVQQMYHKTNSSDDRSELIHQIELVPSTFKTEYESTYSSKNKIFVNSMHHQCVSAKDLPKDLEILAMYAGKDAKPSIEVLRHKTLPIYGVQYHPEELIIDSVGDFIMKKLLKITK
jgi:putative glutamine amidotransferase